MVIFTKSFNKINFNFFIKITKFYIVIDFIISYCQYNKLLRGVTNIVEKLYSSDEQVSLALRISRRTLGLSTNPGEHGLIVLFLITILLLFYFKSKEKDNSIYICFLGIYSILTSQSQTAFVGFIFMNFLVFLFFIKKEKNNFRFRFYFILLSLAVFGFVYKFLNELRYLLSLFELGLNRSSYVKREVKTSLLIDKAFSEPQNIFLGWGKTFFGHYSTAMDNEHLYIYLVYGPFIYLLLIFLLIRFIWKNITKKLFYNQLFLILIVLGLPLSWPNSYYLTPKILMLLVIFYINFYNNKKNEGNFIS
ncbi:hypothetical protein [Tenacibaculum ovolyticum]|uniref:hypothetical protein n=1 Tax=Tenacibaculum ovolyticum TaxID=104270 RepID=UPI003BAD36F1